jgi:hypothetical protein
MVRAARCIARSVAVAALMLAPAAVPGAFAQEPDLTVSNDQIVSLRGSSPSLRGVIQKLCAASGVELRQYEAEDRTWAGNYQDLPLAELLPRLLRTESYAVGMKSGASAAPRIAWVRVMGAATGTPSPIVPAMPPPPPPPPAAEPPPTGDQSSMPPDQATTVLAAMLRPAFTIDDEAARKQQVDRVVAKLNNLADTKMMLKVADPNAVATSLGAFPNARGVFAEIQSGVHDSEAQRYLNAIAGALNGVIARTPPAPPPPEVE